MNEASAVAVKPAAVVIKMRLRAGVVAGDRASAIRSTGARYRESLHH